jgi:hypothetical protein
MQEMWEQKYCLERVIGRNSDEKQCNGDIKQHNCPPSHGKNFLKIF